MCVKIYFFDKFLQKYTNYTDLSKSRYLLIKKTIDTFRSFCVRKMPHTYQI